MARNRNATEKIGDVASTSKRPTTASAKVMLSAKRPVMPSVTAPYAAELFAARRTSKSSRRSTPQATAAGKTKKPSSEIVHGKLVPQKKCQSRKQITGT